MEKEDLYFTHEPTFTIFSAKRRSGKTHLMTHLLRLTSRMFDNVIIINPTHFNGHWKQYTPNIIPTFDEKLMHRLLKRQAELTEKGARNHVLLILDDCLSKANFNSQIFLQLASQGRHYQISCWISTQHYMKIPQALRLNVDYMFIMGTQKGEILKIIYDELAGNFETEKLFLAEVKNNLNNYGCFILNNIRGSYTIFRAPEKLRRFRITINKK
jgi:hypothetical protein